ncbi:MAG TPA: MgtC/SapB family protein [Bryobacteraceae bacterium]|nr:MgtC/SapB family protein [Bryobacteraceae bacterium]
MKPGAGKPHVGLKGFTVSLAMIPRNNLPMTPILNHLLDLGIAYVLALPIGWEREKGDRSAGIRTFPLVAVASCGFLLATEGILEGHQEGRARIIEGVITGMGFIGGGAILKTGETVRGTATAASLWATGAIGVASALRSYDVAVILSVITLITLRVLAPLKSEANDANGATGETEEQK